MRDGLVEGKIALVTGAGSGIGRASTLKFVKEGARVGIVDCNADGGKETLEMVKKAGGEGLFIQADMSKKDDVDMMVNNVIEAYGRLDCAYNNAGIGGSGGLMTEASDEEWDLIMSVNLKGMWYCLRAEITQMLKQGRGVIVNTASIYGLAGAKYNGSYIASKHGVIGLTKAAALEYATLGIRVNCVCPATVNTAMVAPLLADDRKAAIMASLQPLNRVAEPEEIANAAVWLCSDEASFVNGHALAVDGGTSIEVMKLPYELLDMVSTNS